MFHSDSPLRRTLAIATLAIVASHSLTAAPTAHTIMPAPASMRAADGRLAVTPAMSIALRGHDDARLRAGLARALRRAEERTGQTFARTPAAAYVISGDATTAALVIECGGPGVAIPVLGEDESYTLAITPAQAILRAPNARGVFHGLETLLQMLQSDAGGWFLPVATIEDRPRFPWRGLMLDVCRHWQPMEVIKRNLDGMALVKLNVLHLHLTEDQGFRIESKTFPRLHELGSDGLYFTQDEMREIIAYAAERGIRVVPEFDIPGHATSWLVGHPELGSAPGPYVIERRWGIFDPVLDPTNPKVYEVLDGFLTEMAALFPDAYMHIGGDENNGVHWSANATIQQFIKDNNLKDNAGLHAYFNNRVNQILVRNGKKLVGWDEILHPDLAAGSMVHSWRGPQGIAEATARGFTTILSNGYYIDLGHPTADHYLNDPIPPGTTLTAAQQKLVLGGEATMWAEWVTPETIDSRIWPRTAAIAERLWSPQEMRDLDDMHRRLAIVSRRLEEAGLRHESYIDPALRRLAGDGASPADLDSLRIIADLVEPVKGYQRGRQQPESNQFTALTGFADVARPDSASSREFVKLIESALRDPDPRTLERCSGWFHQCVFDGFGLRAASGSSPRLEALRPLFLRIETVGEVGVDTVQALRDGVDPSMGWVNEKLGALSSAAEPFDACEIPFISAVRLLVAAAGSQSERKTMSPAEWRKHLEALAAPPKQPAAAQH